MAFAIVAAVVTVIAAGVSAYASYEQGQQQKKAANFNAKMAEYNAQQAKDAAKAKAEIYEKETRRRLGAMRQQYAAAGVEPTAGTSLAVLIDSAQEAEKDLVRIKAGGEAESWSFMGESELQRSMGASYERAGNIGAGASLLGGAARVISIYAGSRSKSKSTGKE